MIDKLKRFWIWAHSEDGITWLLHGVQGILFAAGTFYLNTAQGVAVEMAYFNAFLVVAAVFSHRETSDIIPAILNAMKKHDSWEAKTEAQSYLTEKLEDGFGDLVSPMIGAALFVLAHSVLTLIGA